MIKCPTRCGSAFLLALSFVLASHATRADLPIEQPGKVERLPEPFQPHWIWVTDLLLERGALVDLDQGRLLGIVSGGYGPLEAVFDPRRREIYVLETHYSRRARGQRTDVLSFYDVNSLAPVDEVVLPPKRAMNTLPSANVALSDDGRFLAVFNMTPATSLSIVDVENRRFIAEIETPGCSLVYAAGPRRFALICMDGALMVVSLDAGGREAGKIRTAPFFDPVADPVTEKAVRFRDQWIFVSFDGKVHPVDVSDTQVRFGETWSLVDEEEFADSWRIGGAQHLAVHQATGRLYSLMHQGGPDTHKEPGTEVWVYDLASQARLQRIRLKSPGLTVMGESIEFGRHWIWPFNRLYDGFIGLIPELGVTSIQVTQDEEPLLVTSSRMTGSMAVHDALTGEFEGRVLSGNMTTHAVQAPFGWSR